MEIGIILTGALLIVIGLLVKAYPSCIAGYNTMSAEEKKNVDIKGLSTFMRNALIGIGLGIIVIYYAFMLAGMYLMAVILPFPLITIGILIFVLISQKYDRNKKKKSHTIMLIIISLIVLSSLAFSAYAYVPTQVSINYKAISFSGLYGLTIEREYIENVEMVDECPRIKIRTNGFSLPGVHKGIYSVVGYGKSRLFIHHNAAGPFIVIKSKHQIATIFNTKDAETARKYYVALTESTP